VRKIAQHRGLDVCFYATEPAGFWSFGNILGSDPEPVMEFRYFVAQNGSEKVAWLAARIKSNVIAEAIRNALIEYLEVNRVVTDGSLPDGLPPEALLSDSQLQVDLSGYAATDGWKSFTVRSPKQPLISGTYFVHPDHIQVKPKIERPYLQKVIEAKLHVTFGNLRVEFA